MILHSCFQYNIISHINLSSLENIRHRFHFALWNTLFTSLPTHVLRMEVELSRKGADPELCKGEFSNLRRGTIITFKRSSRPPPPSRHKISFCVEDWNVFTRPRSKMCVQIKLMQCCTSVYQRRTDQRAYCFCPVCLSKTLTFITN